VVKGMKALADNAKDQRAIKVFDAHPRGREGERGNTLQYRGRRARGAGGGEMQTGQHAGLCFGLVLRRARAQYGIVCCLGAGYIEAILDETQWQGVEFLHSVAIICQLEVIILVGDGVGLNASPAAAPPGTGLSLSIPLWGAKIVRGSARPKATIVLVMTQSHTAVVMGPRLGLLPMYRGAPQPDVFTTLEAYVLPPGFGEYGRHAALH
jgi:hypothetical protein